MFVWGVLKCSLGIGTVFHWRPPDVHIFGTDSSLAITNVEISTELLLFGNKLFFNKSKCFLNS